MRYNTLWLNYFLFEQDVENGSLCVVDGVETAPTTAYNLTTDHIQQTMLVQNQSAASY